LPLITLAHAGGLRITYVSPAGHSGAGTQSGSLIAAGSANPGANRDLHISCAAAVNTGTGRKPLNLEYYFTRPVPGRDTTAAACSSTTVTTAPIDAEYLVVRTTPASTAQLGSDRPLAAVVKLELAPANARDDGQTLALMLGTAGFAAGLTTMLTATLLFAFAAKGRAGPAYRHREWHSRIPSIPLQAEPSEAAGAAEGLDAESAPAEPDDPVQSAPVAAEAAAPDPEASALLARVELMRRAIEQWTQISETAARDLDEEMRQLCRMEGELRQGDCSLPHLVVDFDRYSHASAAKVLHAVDTKVDRERLSAVAQTAAREVVAAAGLELVDPPPNSEPDIYRAQVLTGAIRSHSPQELPGRIAVVERRGLQRQGEIVDYPLVRIFDY
jgi:hypothetical protein